MRPFNGEAVTITEAEKHPVSLTFNRRRPALKIGSKERERQKKKVTGYLHFQARDESLLAIGYITDCPLVSRTVNFSIVSRLINCHSSPSFSTFLTHQKPFCTNELHFFPRRRRINQHVAFIRFQSRYDFVFSHWIV